MINNEITLTVKLPSDINTCWRAITDWNRQGDWMLQTKVWSEEGSDNSLPTTIYAFTGPLYRKYPFAKFLGVLDIMKVTHLDAPYRCDVVHIGKVIQGTGTFILEEISDSSTKFIWSETIKAPRLIFALIKPAISIGVLISLKRLSRILAQ